jgi:site-specific recombinase XerD
VQTRWVPHLLASRESLLEVRLTPLGRRVARAAAKRAGRRAGKGGVSPHWLRHAHATHALERGAPIHIVQATLGHASVATTGRYLHARPTDSSARYLAV